MARWKPDAAGRLQAAAMDLFDERGFESTTVAEIAERAGLAERTFFRHFSDKREVLFWGSADLLLLVTKQIELENDADATPFGTSLAAVRSMATTLFDARREQVRRRQAIVDANPELQEREAKKMTIMTDELATALVGRGIDAPQADLAATATVAVFRVAFRRWVDGSGEMRLADIITTTAAELGRQITTTSTSACS